jgi:hypothetical protein
MKSFFRISIGLIFLVLIVAHLLLVSLMLCPVSVVLGMATGQKVEYIALADIPQYVQQLFPKDAPSKNLSASATTLTEKIANKVLDIRHSKFFDDNDTLEYNFNTLDFGEGVMGIESASEYYFNKPVSSLSFEEALNLAGVYQIFLNR